jgi:hypothetical protein
LENQEVAVAWTYLRADDGRLLSVLRRVVHGLDGRYRGDGYETSG